MNNSRPILMSSAGALFIVAGAALAGQPPDVVQSDSHQNTAMGASAMYFLTTGQQNTAAGYQSLENTNTGTDNTGFGALTLGFNTGGYANDAFGVAALYRNTTGEYNDAFGVQALGSNTTGNFNSAFGYLSLTYNTTGRLNVGVGESSLFSNTTGVFNTAVGANALSANMTGNGNLALGEDAGRATTGSDNIDIANVGAANENYTIRIGNAAHTTAYIAGISNSQVTGSAVYVTSSGQLGVLASSERYKTAIAPMGSETRKLDRLRPVTFHLKTDPKGARQYGLIAEEVDQVYPELVIRDSNGAIQGVRYDELAPMLLNEIQRLQGQVAAQDAKLAAQASTLAEMRELKRQLADLSQLVATLTSEARAERVAMR